MTFEQLKCFIAATQHETFLDAAETLHLSQSCLSKQIIKLEKELDLALFDRQKRSASLTEAGKIFYEEALLLYAQYESSLQKIFKYREASSSCLRLGTLPILSQYQLTDRLHAFSVSYPSVSINLFEAEEKELLENFKADKYDMIIAREYLLTDTDYQTYLLATDKLVAVMSCEHPLTDYSKISLSMLTDTPLLLMNPHTSVYQLCMEQFRNASINPDIKYTGRMESILASVALNEGISLLPQKNMDLFTHKNIVLRPLETEISASVVLATKKQAVLPASFKDFIKIIL